MIRTIAVAAVCTFLVAAAAQVQAARERAYPPGENEGDWLYVQSGVVVSHMAAPLKALAADVYWIRAIQHYGGTKRQLIAVPAPPPALAAPQYQLLYPLLDITTTLDPRFKIAYRFGAVFLAEPYPNGPGRPDLAQALLEKGIRAQPDRWEYMQDIGFVHYWYGHDFLTAARWFDRASNVPGAPWWLRSLAATTLAQGGDRKSSRLMWQSIMQAADNDWLRQDAERRLEQFMALDRIDDVQRRVDEYARRTGTVAESWPSLIRAGLIPGVPIDPRRVPFELVGGRVELSRHSPLYPLPEEPQQTGGGPPS